MVDEDSPYLGMLEREGVSYTITGGGDCDFTRFSIRWKESAARDLASHFGCEATPRAIKDQIVAGFKAAFGDDAVNEAYWHEGKD